MEGLIARLIALTGGLSAAAGVPPEALAALRRLISAIIIQADPAQVFPEIPPDTDPEIVTRPPRARPSPPSGVPPASARA